MSASLLDGGSRWAAMPRKVWAASTDKPARDKVRQQAVVALPRAQGRVGPIANLSGTTDSADYRASQAADKASSGKYIAASGRSCAPRNWHPRRGREQLNGDVEVRHQSETQCRATTSLACRRPTRRRELLGSDATLYPFWAPSRSMLIALALIDRGQRHSIAEGPPQILSTSPLEWRTRARQCPPE